MSTFAKVLIVDDEARLRRAVSAYLEDSGYRVSEAGNGLQGIEVFNREKPDVVVTDLRMPEMNGVDFIRWLRHASPATGVVVLTGTGDREAEVVVLRLGVSAYLTKPIDDLAVLESAIRQHLTPKESQ